VLASADRGMTWHAVSPDLAAPRGVTLTAAATAGGGAIAGPAQGGSIQALALSPINPAVVWGGTSTALIHVTRDGGRGGASGDPGKTWANVTPQNLPPAAVNVIDASHADAGRAYAALLSRDGHPHIYRTDDYGKSWTEISSGLPDGGTARVVREDAGDPNIV